MQSNPMFALSDDSTQASDSPGISSAAPMGTLNSAFSNPMFGADDSLSESPGGDIAGQDEQEEEQVLMIVSAY